MKTCTKRVAALYIDPRGPYPKMADVDAWDEARDATKYEGPYPVVSHPPCGAWGNLRHLATIAKQYADCGPIAVEQVRRWGGVLEQPSLSKLWDHCGLPKPGDLFRDRWGGFSLEVCQVDWGHPARKRTWLYCVRVDMPGYFPPPRQPTHWVSGGRLHDRKGSGGVVPPGIKVCSAQQRRRTPSAFARWLVDIAKTAQPLEVAA